MLISPEFAGVVASGIGLLGLVLSKARCFVRRVAGIWDWPRLLRLHPPPAQILRTGKPMRPSAGPTGSKFEEYLQRGTQVMGAIQAGVKLGEAVLPYLRPLVIAAL